MSKHPRGNAKPKKPYERPQVDARPVELGVYGNYGNNDDWRRRLGPDDPGDGKK